MNAVIALLPYILAIVCVGFPTFVLALALWGCIKAERISRKLPPL